MKWWKHFKTITAHRWMVTKLCFRMGLYRQGLLHDLSKYSPAEFLVGARYYQGYRSPNNKEREEKGYSSAWLHHKGRNKHHYEYWIDYTSRGKGAMNAVEMPLKYVAEMLADRIAASKNYEKENYTDASAWNYYKKGTCVLMHENTAKLLESWLLMLKERGEKETLAYVKERLKDEKKKLKDGGKSCKI